MPMAGRDVQCSNCGKTWFQHHPDNPPEVEEEDEPAPPANAPAPTRRSLDPSVADILREEADTEFAARKRRQAEILESQPDLGLDIADDPEPAPQATAFDDDNADEDDRVTERRALDAKRRMARMRGEPEQTVPSATTAAGALSSRRKLLPDIDEINSTLRNDSSSTASAGAPPTAAEVGEVRRRRVGFRRGFSLMMLLCAALALIYVFAPQIAQAVPAVDPLLNSYVTWVDQIRLGLNNQVSALLAWLDDVASQSNS